MPVEQNECLSQIQLQKLAEQAIKQYAKPYHGRIKLLCLSENTTFQIHTDTARYALRIHRPNYHSKLQIQSELAWLNALSASGMDVPLPIVNEQGEHVITLKLSEHIIRYAVLFDWVEGSMPTVDVDPDAFLQLGQITAKLHHHSKHWKTPEGFQRIIWNHETMVGEHSHWGNWKHAPFLNPQHHHIIEEAIAKIYKQLDSFGQSADRYGLIHADLRLTNLLLRENRVGVIDFDDCGMGWFLHDLAAAISFNEHNAAVPKWIERWLDGYEMVSHLSQQEYELIPTFIMQRRIQMMAWNASHAQTEMALSLGNQWSNETVRLCKKYLENKMPIGI